VSPPEIGTAVAVTFITPLRFGFQLQVAMIFGVEPVVRTFIHPGILFPFAKKVTLEAISKLAFMLIEVLYEAVLTSPDMANELKFDTAATKRVIVT
jgi:hypothetical protein